MNTKFLLSTRAGLRRSFKNIFTISLGILCCCMVLTGCDKNKDKDKDPGTNQFTYNGKIVDTFSGEQVYFGHYEAFGNNANNVDLYIGIGDNLYIALSMLVPNGNNKLLAETYYGDNTFQPYTIASGAILDENFDVISYMTAATVTVKVSGNTYTIDVEATLDNKKTVVGNYTGTLEWFDGSEEDVESYGSLTINKNGTGTTYDFGQGNFSVAARLLSIDFETIDNMTFVFGFLLDKTGYTALPVGTYDVMPGIGNTAGTCNGYIKIGSGSAKNSTSGTVTVAKTGDNYSMIFDFEIAADGSTVTGTYNGPLKSTKAARASVKSMRRALQK